MKRRKRATAIRKSGDVPGGKSNGGFEEKKGIQIPKQNRSPNPRRKRRMGEVKSDIAGC